MRRIPTLAVGLLALAGCGLLPGGPPPERDPHPIDPPETISGTLGPGDTSDQFTYTIPAQARLNTTVLACEDGLNFQAIVEGVPLTDWTCAEVLSGEGTLHVFSPVEPWSVTIEVGFEAGAAIEERAYTLSFSTAAAP